MNEIPLQLCPECGSFALETLEDGRTYCEDCHDGTDYGFLYDDFEEELEDLLDYGLEELDFN